MPNFDKTWSRQETHSFQGKIRDAVKPQGALKPRIQNAVNKLQVQVSKMDSMQTKLRERDAQLFQRIVTAMQQAKLQHRIVTPNDFSYAIDREIYKILPTNRNLPQSERRSIAMYQASHALAMHKLQPNRIITKVTINPITAKVNEESIYQKSIR